jgi:hypothetical protein
VRPTLGWEQPTRVRHAYGHELPARVLQVKLVHTQVVHLGVAARVLKKRGVARRARVTRSTPLEILATAGDTLHTATERWLFARLAVLALAAWATAAAVFGALLLAPLLLGRWALAASPLVSAHDGWALLAGIALVATAQRVSARLRLRT